MLDLFGRLHPLILHLPIGVLALAYMLEIYLYWKKDIDQGIRSVILLFAAITATLSVGTGLLLVRGGDYSGDLVSNHKWVAIGLAAICWALFFMSKKGSSKPYYLTLVSSAIMLVVTGHLGGSLTHGEDFLFDNGDLVVRANVEEAYLYADVIVPIFDDKCVSCHNPSKLKGELNMTSPEHLIAGGENGEIILSDALADSPLLKRIHMPMSMDEHMPPEGKKQLSDEEIRLIEWWITSGADYDKRVVGTHGYTAHKDIVGKFLAPPEANIFDRVTKPDSSFIVKMRSKGYKMYPLSAGSSAVYVNFLNDKTVRKRNITDLRKIRDNIAHINLAGSSITDDFISSLNKFKHLEKLELQNTAITSKGINKLHDFQFLRILNVFNTKVDSTAIDKILSFPQLRDLYLWGTTLTDEQVGEIKLAKPRLNVVHKIEVAMFADAALKAPLINGKDDIFTDSTEVSVDLNFKGANVFYILNGGDTIAYTGPFKIGETTQVEALAIKDTWLPSPVNQRTFVKAGRVIEEIVLHNSPDKRYAKFASKSLINNRFGGAAFRDGEWVGYEGQHARSTLRLDKTSDVSSINVGALEQTGSYIFYPSGIEVSVSDDGKKFNKVATKSYEIASKSSNAGRRNFRVQFPSAKARWIKVDVLGHLKNPEWHAAPGAKNWIFIDEILVN